MKKLVLALMVMSTLAVAHPERKAPPPQRKSQPVKVIKKTTVVRPAPRPTTPFRTYAQDGRTYVTYTPRYTETNGYIEACDNLGCTRYYEYSSYEEYTNNVVIFRVGGKIVLPKDRYEITIVNYR